MVDTREQKATLYAEPEVEVEVEFRPHRPLDHVQASSTAYDEADGYHIANPQPQFAVADYVSAVLHVLHRKSRFLYK